MSDPRSALAIELRALEVGQDLPRTYHDGCGQSGQPGHLDAERAIRGAGLDLAEEDDRVLPLTGRYVEVTDAIVVGGQIRQLVIVGREERPRRLAGEVLGDGPGDGQAIEGRRAASDLVEQDQRAARRVSQDVSRLLHLDHERRLSAQDLIGGADAGEDAVDDADARLAGGDEAPHLRQQGDEGRLTQERRLPAHVGTREDEEANAIAADAEVVRDERVGEDPLHHRMAPLAVAQIVVGCDPRLYVVVSARRLSEGCQDVELGDRTRRLVDSTCLGRESLAQLLEQLHLELEAAFVRPQHFLLELLQLLGDVAFTAGDRLLADVVLGHE